MIYDAFPAPNWSLLLLLPVLWSTFISTCTQEASKLKSLAHAIPEIPKRKRFDLLIPEFTSPLGFELLIYGMCYSCRWWCWWFWGLINALCRARKQRSSTNLQIYLFRRSLAHHNNIFHLDQIRFWCRVISGCESQQKKKKRGHDGVDEITLLIIYNTQAARGEPALKWNLLPRGGIRPSDW